MTKHSKFFRSRIQIPFLLLFGLSISNTANTQDLTVWDQQGLYTGWSARQLSENAKVFSFEGERIGRVENLLVNRSGQISAIIAKITPPQDSVPRHIAIPWNEVVIEEDVLTPVSSQNLGEYTLFQDKIFNEPVIGDLGTLEDDFRVEADFWQASRLIGADVLLSNGIYHGFVYDLVFDEKGELQSIIALAENVEGEVRYFAYPWYGYDFPDFGWSPALGAYVLPYTKEQLAGFNTAFDYALLDIQPE